MNRLALITALYSLVTLDAHAAVIQLTCKHADGFTMNFIVDTDKKQISSSGQDARDVYITNEAFAFILDLSTGSFYHSISRTTGNLTVQAPDKSLIYGHTCERSKQKF